MSSDAFELLGISRNGVTEAAVRKAYAAKLKQIRPEEDREGFMALRQAYETARQQASRAEARRAARQAAKTRRRQQEADAAAAPDGEAAEAPPTQQEIPGGDELPPSRPQVLETAVATSHPRDEPTGDDADRDVRPPPRDAALAELATADDAARWQRPAQVAMEQVRELIAEPWRWQDPAAWREIIDQDAVQPIDDFQEFEHHLRDFFCTESGLHRKEEPERQQWMTDGVLQLLDERFGWTRGNSRNPWEQAQFRWLHALCEPCDWFLWRVPAGGGQFSNPHVVYVEAPTPRPAWYLHPAVAMLAFYAVMSISRLRDHYGIDDRALLEHLGPWAPTLVFLVALPAIVVLVIACVVAIVTLLTETFASLRHGVHRLLRRRGPSNPGWFTATDWLSLVVVVLAIVVIERQVPSPALKVEAAPPPPTHPVPTVPTN